MVTTEQLVTVGENFGRYHVEGILGRGGSGTVYLARERNPHLERHVALKVLDPALTDDASFRERFLRESLLVARLGDHDGIVTIYDAGEERGLLWIAMQYVEGTDLHTVLDQRGRLDPQAALEILRQVTRALDAIHAAGVVHRDVKPRNILVSPDLRRAVITDFGLSKMISSSGSSLTNKGQFVGTLECAAPEQLNGSPVDARTDVYALGCVLFRMLTGRPPFEGGLDSVITAHLSHTVPPVSAFVGDLPPQVDEVVRTAMAKAPADRYGGCAEFLAAYERALPARDGERTIHGATAPPPPSPTFSSSPAGPPPGPPPGPPDTQRPKRRWPIVLGVLLLLAVVGAAALWLLLAREAAFPTAEEEVLVEQARSSFRDTCVRDSAGADAPDVTAAITCEPSGDASLVSLRQLETRDAMDDAFDDELGETPVSDDEFSCLAGSTNAVSPFETNDDLLGAVACYRDGGRSYVLWTVDELRLVGTARSDDRFDADLIAWWADWYGVEVTDEDLVEEEVDVVEEEDIPEDDGQEDDVVEEEDLPEDDVVELTDAELQLLDSVPAALASSCSAAETIYDGEIATLSCLPSGQVDVVEYGLFESNAAMNIAYNDLVDFYGVPFDSGERCPSELPWFSTEAEELVLGRRVCGVLDDGAAETAWTDDRLSILTIAREETGDGEALTVWWENDLGGPVVP